MITTADRASLRKVEPTRYFQPEAHYCPNCGCWKSNDETQPNAVTEACEAGRPSDCPCHDGSEVTA